MLVNVSELPLAEHKDQSQSTSSFVHRQAADFPVTATPVLHSNANVI